MSEHRWWKNGDHPSDNSYKIEDPAGPSFLSEGVVVRRFRHPDYTGTDLCPTCSSAWDIHGWIDQGPEGVTVHPGDYVGENEDGSYYARRDDPLDVNIA